jgi:hypothetical protein
MFTAISFEGKRVAVFGLARPGLACAEALRAAVRHRAGLGRFGGRAWRARKASRAPTRDLREADFAPSMRWC